MKPALPIAAALALLTMPPAPYALAAPPETAAAMTDFRWNNRPLLVFAPHDGHPLLAAQRAKLAGRDAGFAARDMVLVEIVGDRVALDGAPAAAFDAASLRRRFGVDAAEAAVILVGKDGGAKRTQPHALSAAELFATIDAMPMRMREMREAAQ